MGVDDWARGKVFKGETKGLRGAWRRTELMSITNYFLVDFEVHPHL
jgi:hypothetical protein